MNTQSSKRCSINAKANGAEKITRVEIKVGVMNGVEPRLPDGGRDGRSNAALEKRGGEVLKMAEFFLKRKTLAIIEKMDKKGCCNVCSRI